MRLLVLVVLIVLAVSPLVADAQQTGLQRDPEGKGPNLSFQARDRRPRARSWIHLDLYTADQAAEVDRLLDLGATRYPWRYRPGADFVVLQDPGGNLFCVVSKPDEPPNSPLFRWPPVGQRDRARRSTRASSGSRSAIHCSRMPATPVRRYDHEAVLLYTAHVRQNAERTHVAVKRALERTRIIRERADAALQRAEARLNWVRAAKQRLADRLG